MLADYKLPTSELNGIALVREAKGSYGDRIEAIVFSGVPDRSLPQKAVDAQAAAFLEKPVRTDHIKLWIKELGTRIWLQQILDSDPDEVVIMDCRGTILFVDKEKKDVFGEDLIGKECFLTFEKRPPGDEMCKECPGLKAFKEDRKVRTEWDYITRGHIRKHKVHQRDQTVDLVAAPLRDIQGRPRAIIELCRDITMQKTAERTIGKMEEAENWEDRKKLFMDDFRKLGCPRARLYLRDQREGRDEFRMVDYRGKYDPSFKPIAYTLERDRPTQLMIGEGKPLIFRIDDKNRDRDYDQDATINNLYWVGANKAYDNEQLQKKEWIDIPLIAGGKVIGKVSTDGWVPYEDTPDSYDLEVLGRYGASAGQIIQNARNRRDIARRAKIEETILEMSREITNIVKSDVLLQDAVRLACETMQTGMCSIFLLNDESGKLERKQSYGKSTQGNVLTEDDFYTESYGPGEYLTRRIFDEGKAQYINDLQNVVRMEREGITKGTVLLDSIWHYRRVLGEPLCNCLFVPLIVGENKMGLLRATNKLRSNDFGDRDFDDNDIEMFQLLAGQIAVALHNANLQEDKEGYLEDLVHTMKTDLQSLFNVAGKFTKRKALTEKEVKKHGEDLEDALVESKYRLNDFRLMIKAEDPEDYKFAEHRLLPLIEEIVRRERSEVEVKPHLDEIAFTKIWADKRMFQHALHNLLHNAIQYSISKDKPVLIRGSLSDGSVRIDVINYTVEIPEDEREKIFERYYRSDWAKRMSSGAGIGLNTVKKIVDAHNGRIEISSDPVEEDLYKNTFSIFLPLKRGA